MSAVAFAVVRVVCNLEPSAAPLPLIHDEAVITEQLPLAVWLRAKPGLLSVSAHR